MKRYVHSFGLDLVNAVANGKIETFPFRNRSPQYYRFKWLAEHEISSLQQDHEVQHVVFWWFDNFSHKLDSASGYGTIDATHIVEFKEKVDGSHAHQLQSDPLKMSVNRAALPSLSINKNKEPSVVSQ